MTNEEILESLKEEAREASVDIYKAGILKGMGYAIDQVRSAVKEAIRMGMESALSQYDASPENIDRVYAKWCEYMKDNQTE
jgi:hypothetical protein